MTDTNDIINHPLHYNSSQAKCSCGRKIECIDITRWMEFNLGNVVKYLWRAQHKNGMQDILKAQWYLNDEVNKLMSEAQKEQG